MGRLCARLGTLKETAFFQKSPFFAKQLAQLFPRKNYNFVASQQELDTCIDYRVLVELKK